MTATFTMGKLIQWAKCTVSAPCFSKIIFAIKECSIRAQEMVWGTLLIFQETNTKASTGRVFERARVYSRQTMVVSMRVAGTITRCMDAEEKLL